ncbi:hypothetical protein [Dokdonella sp.]|uniref:hypothetical protein n=1 Tax=Dokdonella sp. TaxID=2291710 RepID=UPI0032663E22
MSLSRLYRRLVASRPAVEVDAVELADAMAGDGSASAERVAMVAKIAPSPAHAALARMLQALKPESEALASSVRDSARLTHPMRQRDQRVAAGARRHVKIRRISGIAACLAVAFGLWSWQGSHRQEEVVARATSHSGDRIFTTRDQIFASSEAAPAQNQQRGDQLFKANFTSGS